MLKLWINISMLCIIYANRSLNHILLVNDFLAFLVIRRTVFEIRCGNSHALSIKSEDICLHTGFSLRKYSTFTIPTALCKPLPWFTQMKYGCFGGCWGNYITYNYNRLRDLVVLGLGRDYIWNSISKTFPIKDIFTKFLLIFFFNFFHHNIFYEFNFISSLWIEPLWVNVIFRMVIFLKSAFNLTYEWVKSPF